MHGLSLKEQAIFLCVLCRYCDNPETCPATLLRELGGCPFNFPDNDCEKIPQWAWLPILKERIAPEENQ